MLAENEINRQKALLENNECFVNITSAATTQRGIKVFTNVQEFIDIYETRSKDFSITKFVPASGAATRMFKRMIAFEKQPNLKNLNEGASYSVRNSINSLTKFAFFHFLKNEVAKSDNLEEIVRKILYQPMNYASLPKGLIAFHYYGDFARTAFCEQLHEAVALNKSCKPAKIEFTISEEHFSNFNRQLVDVIQQDSLNVNVNFSFQDKATNTIAIYENGELVYTDTGELLTRPGGHGSLLQNLNKIDSDIIFIKNIDNIAHQDYWKETLNYKKMLGGVLINFAEKIKVLAEMLTTDSSCENCQLVADFLNQTFYADFDLNSANIADEMLEFMNRPLRVCGMVKNTGEPGGGPFFVQKNGVTSLQIIEKAQINTDDQEQKSLLDAATHFNPVDIVCYVKDINGQKFDLLQYSDTSTCFISEKTYNGKTIRVLEHPGLWNGAMANWLTIFVELPLITFNPVKELNDLLRKEHQQKS